MRIPRVIIFFRDFNGDGKQDLALAAVTEQAVFVYLGDGSGGFGSSHKDVALGLPPVMMRVADMDGDGKRDLVVMAARNSEGSLFVLYGNGDGTFRPSPPTLPLSFPTGGTTSSAMALADLDCDGLPEIVLSTSGTNLTNNFTLIPPPENNSFSAATPTAFSLQGEIISITAAPFDADTLVDLAVLTKPAEIKIYRNTSR